MSRKRRHKGSGRRKSTRRAAKKSAATPETAELTPESHAAPEPARTTEADGPESKILKRNGDEVARTHEPEATRAEPAAKTTPEPRDPSPSSSDVPAMSPAVSSPLTSRPIAGPLPRSMRITLYASLSAAVLSAAMALYVVMRDDPQAERPGLVRTASAATTVPDDPETDEAEDSVIERDEAVLADTPAELDWPDLTLGELPPTGAAPPELGQSVGSPRDGALLSPTRLPNGPGHVIRDENTAWGTSNTVAHLRKAIQSLRRQHPQVHRVIIGDISTRRGGPLPGHTSHQSGRDVDIGLMLRGRTDAAATEFIEATRDNLDRRATYDLIEALAATRDDPTGVELIVLDYGLQRLLRNAAAARGVPEDTLEALFQFPHGPTSRHGLVRHKPAHRDHMHVRFRCPEGDRYCREPLIGFAGMEASEPTGRD